MSPSAGVRENRNVMSEARAQSTVMSATDTRSETPQCHTRKMVLVNCSVCGAGQEFPQRTFEALKRMHPDRPLLCADCAVDRPGAFGKR